MTYSTTVGGRGLKWPKIGDVVYGWPPTNRMSSFGLIEKIWSCLVLIKLYKNIFFDSCLHFSLNMPVAIGWLELAFMPIKAIMYLA